MYIHPTLTAAPESGVSSMPAPELRGISSARGWVFWGGVRQQSCTNACYRIHYCSVTV